MTPPTVFTLDAYLERIRLASAPAADVDGLIALQRAHRLAIPFENLDVILGRPILIDGASVFAKLVSAGRGGYCFEHGRLLLDALEALGFTARPLLARVWLGVSEVPPLTHTLALVTIDGVEWIADAGFGGSYSPPMPLTDGAEVEGPDGSRFRLARDPAFGWMLSRDGHPAHTDGRGTGEGWRQQYSFTTAPVFPADLMLGNHWVQTAPESRFVQRRIVSIPLPSGFVTLDGTAYRRRNGDQANAAEIADPRVYRLRLAMMFGIALSAEEVAGLGLFEPSGYGA